jgi:hypothetical protein
MAIFKISSLALASQFHAYALLLLTVEHKVGYKLGINSNGITFIPVFVKIDKVVQK